MVPFRRSRLIFNFMTQSNSTQANYTASQNHHQSIEKTIPSTPLSTTPTTALTMTSSSSPSTAPPQPSLHPPRPPPPHPSASPSAVQAFLKQYFLWAYGGNEQKATQQAAKFVGNGDMLYVLSKKRGEELWLEAGLVLYDDLRASPHISVRQMICCDEGLP